MKESVFLKYYQKTFKYIILLFCFILCWYAAGRILSPFTSVVIKNEQDEGAFTPRLKICIYNIAHGRGLAEDNWNISKDPAYPERLTDIAEFLVKENPDIVILNEVDFNSTWSDGIDQAEWIAKHAGFPFRAKQVNYNASIPFAGIKFGNAILSKYPIEEADIVDYPGLKAWETVLAGKKKGLLCKIKLSGGKRVRVLAVHLEHRSERIRLQSVRVIEKIRKSSNIPLIAAGDFNSTRIGFPKARTDSMGRTAVSWLLDQKGFVTLPVKKPGQGELTFSSANPKSVIDWIMVPPDWKIISKRVLKSSLSDHCPVIMDVMLK